MTDQEKADVLDKLVKYWLDTYVESKLDEDTGYMLYRIRDPEETDAT